MSFQTEPRAPDAVDDVLMKQLGTVLAGLFEPRPAALVFLSLRAAKARGVKGALEAEEREATEAANAASAGLLDGGDASYADYAAALDRQRNANLALARRRNPGRSPRPVLDPVFFG